MSGGEGRALAMLALLPLLLGCGLTEPDCVVVVGPDVLIAAGDYDLRQAAPGTAVPLLAGADSLEVYVNPNGRQLRATYVVDGRRVQQVWRMENRRVEP